MAWLSCTRHNLLLMDIVDDRIVPDSSYRSVPGRDVLQSSQGGLLRAMTHAASQQGQVHADSDGAPKPLAALRVRLFLQQGAAFLHMLKKKSLVRHSERISLFSPTLTDNYQHI